MQDYTVQRPFERQPMVLAALLIAAALAFVAGFTAVRLSAGDDEPNSVAVSVPASETTTTDQRDAAATAGALSEVSDEALTPERTGEVAGAAQTPRATAPAAPSVTTNATAGVSVGSPTRARPPRPVPTVAAAGAVPTSAAPRPAAPVAPAATLGEDIAHVQATVDAQWRHLARREFAALYATLSPVAQEGCPYGEFASRASTAADQLGNGYRIVHLQVSIDDGQFARVVFTIEFADGSTRRVHPDAPQRFVKLDGAWYDDGGNGGC